MTALGVRVVVNGLFTRALYQGTGAGGAQWSVTDTEAVAVRSASGDLEWDCSGSLSARKNIFNPSSPSGTPAVPASTVCSTEGEYSADQCKPGDLTGYLGQLEGSTGHIRAVYTHPSIMLSGSLSVVGRALSITSADGTRSACAPLTTDSLAIELEATFTAPDSDAIYNGALTGSVRLRQADGAKDADTGVVVDLGYECSRAGYSWPHKLRKYTETSKGAPYVVYTVEKSDPYGKQTEEVAENKLVDKSSSGLGGVFGPTIGTRPLASAEACSDLCTGDQNCKAWTWASPSAPANSSLGTLTGDCLLLANAPAEMIEVEVAGFVSGARGCPTPVKKKVHAWYVSDQEPSESDACNTALANAYDPSQVRSTCTDSMRACAVGDLSGKHGKLAIPSSGNGAVFTDEQLPLQGPGSLVNRPIVVSYEDSAGIRTNFCARLRPKYARSVIDVDSGAGARSGGGIAITGLSAAHGRWEAKLSSSSAKSEPQGVRTDDWQPLDASVISPTNALRVLATDTNLLRFIPDDSFAGAVTCPECPEGRQGLVCKPCKLNMTAGEVSFVGWDVTDGAEDGTFGDVSHFCVHVLVQPARRTLLTFKSAACFLSVVCPGLTRTCACLFLFFRAFTDGRNMCVSSDSSLSTWCLFIGSL